MDSVDHNMTAKIDVEVTDNYGHYARMSASASFKVWELAVKYWRDAGTHKEDKVVVGREIEFRAYASPFCVNWQWDMRDGSPDAWNPTPQPSAQFGALTRIPVEMTTWALWKAKYPDTLVVSSDTGFDRDYGTDPYLGYEESEKIWYKVKNEDKRIFPKDIVYGVIFAGEAKAYVKSNITAIGVVNDEVGKQKLAVIYDKDLDTVKIFDRNVKGRELSFELVVDKIVDTETKSVWNYDGVAIEGTMKSERLKRIDATYGFWYVWVAFYPKTGLLLINK